MCLCTPGYSVPRTGAGSDGVRGRGSPRPAGVLVSAPCERQTSADTRKQPGCRSAPRYGTRTVRPYIAFALFNRRTNTTINSTAGRRLTAPRHAGGRRLSSRSSAPARHLLPAAMQRLTTPLLVLASGGCQWRQPVAHAEFPAAPSPGTCGIGEDHVRSFFLRAPAL